MHNETETSYKSALQAGVMEADSPSNITFYDVKPEIVGNLDSATRDIYSSVSDRLQLEVEFTRATHWFLIYYVTFTFNANYFEKQFTSDSIESYLMSDIQDQVEEQCDMLRNQIEEFVSKSKDTNFCELHMCTCVYEMK